MIQVKRVGDHKLPVPRRETVEAAGFDLRSAVTWVVYPGEQAAIPTGFAWSIPEGMVGLVRDRSGLAARGRITTTAGVIDSDYRGEITVLLRNDGDLSFKIAPGDRIAQLVVVQCLLGYCEEVSELSETARGAGGFGHTGVA